MAECPSCKNSVAPDAKNCPACGQLMPAVQQGTLQIGAHFGDDLATGQPAEHTAPEPVQPINPVQPVEATLPSSTLQPAADSAQGTLGAPVISEPAKKRPWETGTPPVAKLPENQAADPDATLQISDAREAQPAHGTVEYGDKDLMDAESGKGKSGTAGRLKRLWQGVAGSSANPMHTLKGDDAMATDSVFAKVARRVLVTDTDIDITESVPSSTASQPEKRARVRECIALACQGSDSEVADYNLTGFLGQGGMGVVLKAYQRAIGRDVAIKMIQPSSGQSTSSTNAQKKKFFYEAQITGKLDHPNIVPVYELGVTNDILFYSMKMIIGKEWKEVMQANSREENLDILMKVSDAMAFAHQKRIIHRDLKPENVMLGPFGEVLVTDWGCAVDLNRGESFTGAGSPPWMAPEMADHNVTKIGTRSDIYLLGAMLYQVIAGYPPHPGQTVFECLANAQKNVIIPVEAEDPLLDIALRAMEMNPDDRYQTVEAMQEAIREYRRHAESITLSDRAEVLLRQAIASKDYERFSRTIFGFQDAAELWPGNSAAQAGLAEARLAYGKCAFDKGDYDLCVQSLNQNVPAEAELYAKAVKAKKAAEERERRFKTLRRAFAAVVLLGLGVSSILAGVAWVQRGKAVVARNQAIEQKTIADQQRGIAEDKTKEAIAQKIIADEQRGIAEDKTKEAIAQKTEADRQKGIAEDKTKEAIAQKTIADEQKEIAQNQKLEADKQRGIAENARDEAEQRAAQIELGNFRSNLALSLGQVQQLNVASADAGLDILVDPSSYKALESRGKLPKFDNWPLERVRLLSNSELLSEPLGDVSAVAFADRANLGVVATTAAGKGNLQIVQLDGKKLKVIQHRATEATVGCVAISPNGDEIVYTLKSTEGDGTLYRWSLTEGSAPVKVEQNGKRSLQAFVMTADKVVGGINGGLWVWSRNANWQDSKPTQIKDVRGQLQSLQLLNESTALVLSNFDGQLVASLVNLAQASGQSIEFVAEESSEFKSTELAAVAFANGKLIVGNSRGKLFSVDMTPTSTKVGPEFRQILPQQHQSSIRSIRVHPDGTLLTTAFEPVVQVWKPSTTDLPGWRHDSYLAGTPDNIGGASFMTSSNLVLGVGEKGQAIVWDVLRQKQRQRLERLKADGSALVYQSPVIEVVPASDNSRAVSIHQDGTVDNWDMVTGKTIGDANAPTLSFVGHSPRATFVDMAIAGDAGILVTSAILPNQDAESQPNVWEFCKWDLNSGKMIDRWTKESELALRISLLESGESILYSSDDKTIIEETRSNGKTRFMIENLGSYFAAVHPIQKHLSMMVKRSGAVRVFDLSKADGGINAAGNRIDYEVAENSVLLSDDDVPLLGEWAPAGDRFYMIWTSGRITEFVWENSQLSKGRDLRGVELSDLQIGLNLVNVESKTLAGGARLSSPWQMDLKVRSQEGYNLVYMGIRLPGVDGRTRLVRVEFPQDLNRKVRAQKDEQPLQRMKFVLTDSAAPAVDLGPLSILPVASSDVFAARAIGKTIYCASTTGTIYRVSESNEVSVFGRPETLSGCGNLDANKVVTLHQGGVLWRGDWTNGKWDWTQLTSTMDGARQVEMSPDGTRLLISFTTSVGESGLLIAETETGKVLETIDQAQCGVWSAAGDLAVVLMDGQVELRGATETKAIGSLAGLKAHSVHFFSETWSDGTQAKWLAVQTLSADGVGTIHYLSADPQADVKVMERSMTLAAGMNVLACSPNEGVFVTGGEGVVAVHFASPTLKEYGKLLFNLEGHAGANVQCLQFSHDGRTLISTDSRNRLLGWLSEDLLGGIGELPEFTSATLPIQ